MLGEAQWKWLEIQLEVPAEVRLLVSSIQVVSDEHPFEKWGTMPAERERLYALLRKTRASGVVVLSGDRHLGEISQDATAIGYPLFDVTASGLNQATLRWRPTEPNRARVAALPFGNHFGSVEIDWLAADPEVRLQLRHEDGQIAVQSRVPLSLLQAPPASPPLPSGVSGPEQAIAMSEGTQATVQFRVAGGRMLGNRSRLLLNSQEDFRNLRNMTVVVNPSALTGRYSDAELKTFLGKTIRATGRISLYNGAKQLEIDSADRLEIVEGS
jgi:alkaline phosphatase D